jgi:16S rRNA (cytidine1402-2'-O)-methyltransferase
MALYLIPTFLSENSCVLPQNTIDIAKQIDEFIVENEKSARAFLKIISTNIPQSNLTFHLLNEHSLETDIDALGKVIRKKKDIGLLSEAGCPAVADPGAAVVALAHKSNIKVIPLTGPSSIMLALMSSGLNGQSFIFHGYLPIESVQRKKFISTIERDCHKKNQTQIFIETPYRNLQLFNDIIQTCSEETRLCVACNITSENEMIMTMNISQWKKQIPEINKKPAIFLIG